MSSLEQSFDPSVSNGTCWTADGQQADRIYIPCGNGAIGPQTCCQARDICLSSRACYNARWGVTYMAGCTDPGYNDNSVCPDKGIYSVQQWVGLARCFVSDDKTRNAEEWIRCKDDNQPSVTVPNPCTCDITSHVVAFTDSPVLTNIASLPVTVGNIIAWYPGLEPFKTFSASHATAVTQSATLISTSQPTSEPTLPTSTSPTTTSQNTSSRSWSQTPERDGNLSASAKAGIGTGAAVGAIIACLLLAWFIRRLRSKKRTVQLPEVIDQIRPRSHLDPAFHNTYAAANGTSNARESSLSGHQSELDGNEVSPSLSRRSHALLWPHARHGSLGQILEHGKIDTDLTTGVKSRTPVGSPTRFRQGQDVDAPRYELPG